MTAMDLGFKDLGNNSTGISSVFHISRINISKWAQVLPVVSRVYQLNDQ